MGGRAPESSVGALVPPFGRRQGGDAATPESSALPLLQHGSLFWAPLKGRRGGGGPGWRRGGLGQGGGQGGEMGGGTKEQCGRKQELLKNQTIGLIWLVTKGGWGEAWGVGQGSGQGGEMGGAPESSVGATRGFYGLSQKLAGDVGGWGGGVGGGPGRRARGEMGGGGTGEQCGSNKAALVPPFGCWGGGRRGGWAREAGKGGGDGGSRELGGEVERDKMWRR